MDFPVGNKEIIAFLKREKLPNIGYPGWEKLKNLRGHPAPTLIFFSSIGALEMQMSVCLSVGLHSLYLGQNQGRATLGLDRDLGFSR